MNMTEEMIRGLAHSITGSAKLNYCDTTLDFEAPWRRLRMVDAIKE